VRVGANARAIEIVAAGTSVSIVNVSYIYLQNQDKALMHFIESERFDLQQVLVSQVKMLSFRGVNRR
jgi:hypothetical protein